MGINIDEGKWCYMFATGRGKFVVGEDIISTGGDNSPNDLVNKIKMGWDIFYY